MGRADAERDALVAKGSIPHAITIPAMMTPFNLHSVLQLLALEDIVDIRAVATIEDKSTGDILCIHDHDRSIRELKEEIARFLLHVPHECSRTKVTST